MQVKAKGKNVKISPRKIRLIANVVRGMDAVEAERQLVFMPHKGARLMREILKSAIANGENNHDMVKENLYIEFVTCDEGRTLVRYQPRAFGRAFPIRKRESHITVILNERKEGKRQKKEKATAKPKPVNYDAKSEAVDKKVSSTSSGQEDEKEEKKTFTAPDGKKFEDKKSGKMRKGFKQRFFRRKAQ
ncbi:MAG: 50S ribosomal protein L22 [bacterium]